MKSSVAVLAGLAGRLMRQKHYVPVVPSHKIEQETYSEQLSKRKLARAKGKKARSNRGRNRKSQETSMYAMLRR